MASDYKAISAYNEEQLGKDRASRKSQVAMYTDPVHFIYELIQNADDAGATKINFQLKEKELIIEHNGLPFTESNVKAISYFEKSDKTDSGEEITKIGHFGLGFKSVFAYTASPRIHSGKENFKITQLYTVEAIPSPTSLKDDITKFILPFDHLDEKPDFIEKRKLKSPADAYKDIENKFTNLGADTIIFTKSIQEICWTSAEISKNYRRVSLNICDFSNEVKILANNTLQGCYLIFDQLIFWKDEDNIRRQHRPAQIAYKLDKPRNENGVIDKISNARLSVFFPTTMETHVGFIMQGPYRTNPSRENIFSEDEFNKYLIKETADLLIRSLHKLKELDLLNLDTLSVLPNSDDTLENFFKPISDALIAAFNTQPLLPTISGKYAPADYHYRADKSITGTKDQPGLVSIADLKLLTNNDKAMWLENAPSRGRVNDFIEDTEVKKWDLHNIFRYSDKEKLETWLIGKSDQWLLLFYELLNENQITKLRDLNIKLVRVHSANCDIHLPANEVYLAPKDDVEPLPSDIYFVKKSTYQKQGNEEGNSKAEQTLLSLGVEPYNEETVIKLILDKHYSSHSSIPLENHIQDIGKFIAFWLRNRYKSKIFKSFYFLRSNVDGDIKFQKPENLCLDSPYIETGLSDFIDIHRKESIWYGYAEKMEELNCTLNEFIRFLQDVGVFYKLEVTPLEERDARCNPIIPSDWNYYYGYSQRKQWNSPNRKAKDYSITDLKQYLEKNNVSACRLIWNALIAAPNDAMRAEFAENRNRQKSGESQLVQKLKDAYWIPDKSGSFKKPCEITKEDLRNDFKYEIKANLLEAIGFGEHAKDMRKKQTALEYLEAQGIDTDELDEFVKLKKECCFDPEVFRKYVAKQKRKEFPKAPVDTANPEILKQKIIQNSEDQPEKESVKIERSIQKDLPKEKAEAKAYLRGKYRNSDYELICQCCKDEMPFKIDEYHYFEAVQFIKNIAKTYKQNYLALCPICAAKYKYARETADDDIRRSLVENDSPNDSPSVVIPVRLAGEDASIEFVGKHWFELKTILRHLNPDTDLESLILDLQPQYVQLL